MNNAKARRLILSRDSYACRICKYDGARLHIHHIDKKRTNNEPNNLVTLCPDCHRRVRHCYIAFHANDVPLWGCHPPQPIDDKAMKGQWIAYLNKEPNALMKSPPYCASPHIERDDLIELEID